MRSTHLYVPLQQSMTFVASRPVPEVPTFNKLPAPLPVRVVTAGVVLCAVVVRRCNVFTTLPLGGELVAAQDAGAIA